MIVIINKFNSMKTVNLSVYLSTLISIQLFVSIGHMKNKFKQL